LKNITKPHKSDSHRLAGIHSRQAVHSRTQKLGKIGASPGGTLMTVRRFLGENLKTYEKQRK